MGLNSTLLRFIVGSVPPTHPLRVDSVTSFRYESIDGTPFLEESYRLRYRTYCLERNYLPAAEYPDGREVDEYDDQSVHMGLFSDRRELVGTFRLVWPAPKPPPLFRRCVIDPRAKPFLERPAPEVSRFILSSDWARRTNESPSTESRAVDPAGAPPSVERRSGPGHVMELLRAVYHLCKRRGVPLFYLATDRFFSRLLVRYGVPHETLGPEVDYFGSVRPFAVNIEAMERAYAFARPDLLAWWREGLEGDEPSAVRPTEFRHKGFSAGVVARRVREARVLLAGCDWGGPLTDALTQRGFERFVLADGAVAESGDPLLAGDDGAGGPRVEALARRLGKCAPGARVTIVPEGPGGGNTARLVSEADIVCLAADFLDVPGLLRFHDECRRQYKPIVTAWETGTGAVACVVLPGAEWSFRRWLGLPEISRVPPRSHAKILHGFFESHPDLMNPGAAAAILESLSVLGEGRPCAAPSLPTAPVAIGLGVAEIVHRVIAGVPVRQVPEILRV